MISRILNGIDKALVKIADWSVCISVVCLLIATLLSFANVCTTKLFHFAINNTTELVQYLLVPIVYCAVAKVQMDGGLMHVDLISRLFPQRLQDVIGSIGALLGTVMYGFAGYSAVSLLQRNYALHKTASSSVTSFEIWPFVLVYVVFSFLLAIALLWSLVRALWMRKIPKSIADEDYDGGGIVL